MSTGLRAARVRQGIALMDFHYGPQWVWKVDPDRLEISSACGCVVGQATGCSDAIGYWDEIERMGIDDDFDAGFNLNEGEDSAGLNRIWAFAIRRLREQRPQGGVA